MVIVWAIMVFMPLYGNHFGFQRMDDKVKDGLVLSVVWRQRDTQSSLGLCFFFVRTIKGGMGWQFNLGESNGLDVVHTC